MPHKDIEKRRVHARERMRQYRIKNRVRLRAQQREHDAKRRNTPGRLERKRELEAERRARPGFQDQRKTFLLQRHYNLTRQEYDALVLAQSGACKVCRVQFRSEEKRKSARPCVDHCHQTGRVRGILCGRCNRAIGLLQDDSTLVLWAFLYLVSGC